MQIKITWISGQVTTHEVFSIDTKSRLVTAYNQLGQQVLILSPVHFRMIEIQR